MICYKLVTSDFGSYTVPAQSKYYLKYRVGSTVKARPGTLGIACFSTAEHAIAFQDPKGGSRLLRVRGIGKPSYLVYITPFWRHGHAVADVILDRFYEESVKDGLVTPPEGSVWFKKIKVLEEVVV